MSFPGLEHLATKMAHLQLPLHFYRSLASYNAMEQWQGLSETFLIASGATSLARIADGPYFYNAWDRSEVQRIYHTLPAHSYAGFLCSGDSEARSTAGAAVETYAETLARLTKHFTPSVNVVCREIQISQRSQLQMKLLMSM